MRPDPAVERVWAQVYTVPTDFPEADGTASWTSTTIIVVRVQAGGMRGIGYTYSDASVAALVGDKLATIVIGLDAMDPPAAWRAMQVAVRNFGREGLAATAISAVDTALWDLKGRLLPFIRSTAAAMAALHSAREKKVTLRSRPRMYD
jgi:L-alanine-DL-glutamate epimerase-like enolase superfamily enzyme